MIDLTLEQNRILFAILDRVVPSYPVRVFGSRWKHEGRADSDLDLVLVGEEKVPLATMAELRLAFEESDLPFTVDVSDWNRLTPEFRKVIDKGYGVLK